jgi:ribosomal protein S18 acetylase RimI-like enzyme
MVPRSVDEPRDRRQPAGRVRLATRSDVDAMCNTLVEAFAFDPVASWVYPEEEQRRIYLSEWYELTLGAGLRCGHTYTAADNRAVAIWSPPSVSHMFDWEREGTAIADMLKRQLGERTNIVMNGLMAIESAHPLGIPHFYLAMLGTSPAMQGRGLAGALLGEVLGRCDREGWPAYLETSLERNVRFYESQRFEVTGRTSLPDGPPVWFMWRDPESL